jgi:hypothetical protein
MSITLAPADLEDRFIPVFGRAAFETDSPRGTSSRAGQFLAMGTYAFGTEPQAADVRDDADDLGVPFVASATDEHAIWRDQDRLDDLTRYALQDHGASDPRDWQPGAPTRPDDEVALWQEVEYTHSVPPLLALLNYSLGAEHELERVAAAASLRRFSDARLAVANAVVTDALTSADEHVAEVARASIGAEGEGAINLTPSMTDQPSMERGPAPDEEVSIAIHGTWAQVTADPWYAPGRPLHRHIRTTSTENLYNEISFFTWSGEYSQEARDAGATKLPQWREIHAVGPFDTVFTHSHGGNVALSAAAHGERVRMLVLMHVPALPRSDEEWSAIRGQVGRVVVMRTRLDHVVLADGLRNGSTQRFDQAKLPHTPVVLHWANKDAWFSHNFFTELDNWTKYDLSGVIIREHQYAARLVVA